MFFEWERRANRFDCLDIQSKHCEGIIGLPLHHKDPFDRLLVAQAIEEGLSILTSNKKFWKYDVEVLW
jgi:PIN domain nuclease of toxin-antitoxin system